MNQSPLPPETQIKPNEVGEAKEHILRILRQAYAHAKGLGALLTLIGSLLAIMALYTYLSAIERLDLFLPSISIGPALFIWLFFVILVFLAFLLFIATPSVLFGMLLTIFGLSEDDLRDFAPTLAGITVAGFGLFSLAVLFTPSDHIAFTIAALFAASLISVAFTVAGTAERRDKYLKKVGEKDGWYLTKASVFIIMISSILMMVVLTGIFPALFTTWSHPELKSDSDDYLLMLLSFCSMALSCMPVLAFYVSRGALITRLTKGLTAIFAVLVIFVFISPSVFKVIAYSAASAVNLRDPQISEYIVGKKYPSSTFDSETWRVTELHDENKTITIKAFKLFKFGDTLLLCPAKYASAKRDDVASYSKGCFSTSSTEMTLAAPKIQKSTFYLRETYCGRVVTPPPFLLSQKHRCVFAPSKLEANNEH